MKKIIVILVIMLLTTTTILPTISALNKIINEEIKQINEFHEQDIVPGEFIVKFKENSVIDCTSIVNLFEKHQISSMERVFKNSENSIWHKILIYNEL